MRAMILVAVLTMAAGAVTVTARARPPYDPVHASLSDDLPALIGFVEAERHHTFAGMPRVVAESVAAIDHDAGFRPRTVTTHADLGTTYEAVGLADSAKAFDATVETSADLLGIYLEATHLVLVHSGPDTPLLRSVVVHELTHALDDQLFTFRTIYATKIPQTVDSSRAVQSLIEGDARAVEDDYVTSLGASDRSAYDAERAALTESLQPVDAARDAAARAVHDLTEFPYDPGAAFIRSLRGAGGQARVDAAFRNPPQDTAEIYARATTFAAAPKPPVPEVEEGGEIRDVLTFGAAGLSAVLEANGVSLPDREAAAAAWAGDHSVTWTGDEFADPSIPATQLPHDSCPAEECDIAALDSPDGTIPGADPHGTLDCIRWDVRARDAAGQRVLHAALDRVGAGGLRHSVRDDVGAHGVTLTTCR